MMIRMSGNRGWQARSGFTLIELLVVILVIVTLIGLLLPGVALIRNVQAKNATSHLFEQIAFATTEYLEQHGTLPTDYENNLPGFLTTIPQAAGQTALVALAPHNINGSKLLDSWGNDVIVTVSRQSAVGRNYIREIVLKSKGKKVAAADTDDDIVFRYYTDDPSVRPAFALQR
jgi:prepilin-type N-terminal cleavage/methylation domain-containing protein